MFLILLAININRHSLLLFLNYFCIFASKNATTIYMISKTYKKYIWILNTLLKEDLSFKEIETRWKNSYLCEGGLSIRTFHECREGIKEMFGVEIECDRKKNEYYVKNPEVLNENRLAKWLLRKYSIPKDFATFNGMKDRVLLEEIPLGQTFLDNILDAMQRNVELQIDYQRYERGQEEEHMQTFHFQPYALKVYNRRWYLLGYKKEKEDLRLISLDRIHDLKKTSTHFELPSDFDARKYFADVVGVYKDKDKQAMNVKIRAYGVQAEYLRSTPLHKSQAEVRSKHGEFAEFTYRLCITPELISQLLAMGENVEVLEPKELKDEMKKRIINMFNFYK